MSTFRRMIEAAAGRAVTRTSSDGNRITVILAREDAEDFEINRAIRLVLTASPLSVVAHYTDAGSFEARAGYWVPGSDAACAVSLAEARAEPAFIGLSLALGDRHARDARAAFSVA
ncbi:hypothetical protein MKK75_01065 [Methylobacterium sp. J-030]|uniref:hypothetical protein n=1 Tax=Methylobacterium sp. J-030 TaxID=2836627 RepID=UPI001FBBD34F|nr:hypothetical protein [Methylobacterium sp. J-030]MCJ2067406.1 hypothetical protein [Methylobacterium sp. J-030]